MLEFLSWIVPPSYIILYSEYLFHTPFVNITIATITMPMQPKTVTYFKTLVSLIYYNKTAADFKPRL